MRKKIASGDIKPSQRRHDQINIKAFYFTVLTSKKQYSVKNIRYHTDAGKFNGYINLIMFKTIVSGEIFNNELVILWVQIDKLSGS